MKSKEDYLEVYLMGCASVPGIDDVERKWLNSLVNGLHFNIVTFQRVYDQMTGYYMGQYAAGAIELVELDGCLDNLTDMGQEILI